MMIRSSLGTCTKNAVYLMGSSCKQMRSHTFGVTSQPSSGLCNFCSSSKHSKLKYTVISSSKVNYGLHSIDFQAPRGFCFLSNISKAKNSCHSLTFKSIFNPGRYHRTRVNISIGDENMGLLVPTQRRIPRSKGNSGLASCQQHRASTGLLIGLLVCFSTSGAANAEAPDSNGKRVVDCDTSAAQYSHGKNVYTDYSVIGIPGDGRCLFRSVAHGACLRSGKSAPNESLQRELADELQAMVADEFVKRREETEWFIEGDFDTYISQIRKPHVWGGEPELLMASHVLRMPITVYMYDKDCGGVISIAEYGQEYGKDDPIKVLYHGFGHYDALHIPGKGGSRSRL